LCDLDYNPLMKTKLYYLQKCEKSSPDKTGYHSHDFWQLEIVTYGCLHAMIGDEPIVLNTGDMLLIKPSTEHTFIYETSRISWITIKFDTTESISDTGLTIRHSLFTSRLISSLETILYSTILQDYEKKLVEGHIESLFYYIRSKDFSKPADRNNLLLREIFEYIREKNGKPVFINDLAENLSYTRSHISKEFQKLTGQSLKAYIDRVRLDKSKEMLLYSDFSISDIAFELGFADIYSFSRFFKKHTAVCPKEYKKKSSEGRSASLYAGKGLPLY